MHHLAVGKHPAGAPDADKPIENDVAQVVLSAYWATDIAARSADRQELDAVMTVLF